ncbi:hypothetical protein [Clostridium grantii]|uniref:Uncharacterized protein n=1 Tax=Clostridium grantii DSM 8605 TaxID=1121316 RepID=A0A1M5SBN0_9CLOT|nr:hypothetical protein [Clostridium grantii]SHH35924.1 hypothetical protein SAMN02745207_00854 [Clostridium grantii DSM 8605]
MDTIKRLAKGTLGTTETTLFTATKTTIIKEIILHNTNVSTAKNATIKFADMQVYNVDIQAKETIIIHLALVIANTETIKASGEVNYYVSGIELA